MSAVTNADVEAAAERIERLTGYDMAHCQEIARAALATIAPRIDAARREGFEEARDRIVDILNTHGHSSITDAIAALKPEDAP